MLLASMEAAVCVCLFPECFVGKSSFWLHLFNSEVIDEVMIMFIQTAVQCDAITVH